MDETTYRHAASHDHSGAPTGVHAVRSFGRLGRQPAVTMERPSLPAMSHSTLDASRLSAAFRYAGTVVN